MRKEKLINNDWEFMRLDPGTELADFRKATGCRTAVSISELSPERRRGGLLQKISIPHDWLIYDTNNLYMDSTGWYRKVLDLKKEQGRRYLINFDGVYMDSTVYVNEKPAGTHHYGYSAFEYDITDLLENGENEILVQVRYKSPNTRWYSGAGIFRDVTFKSVPETHIATDGVYVSPKKVLGKWQVRVETEVEGPEADKTYIRAEVTQKGAPSGEAGGDVEVSDIAYDGKYFSFCIDNPLIWDITSPNLYDLKVSLYSQQNEIDSQTVVFGLKEAVFTSDNGLILNGRKVKIQGVCDHHDLGCLGAGFNRNAMRRKILLLKEMGVNAIRTSHNMPARAFMELADEMGIMVDSEGFDMWRHAKTEFDYSRFFNEDCADDVRSWIRRDRNHPSVIMWSIGNEIYDCHADADAPDVARMLKENVEKWDHMHNAPVTHASNYMQWEGAQRCTEELDLAGYNYGERLYNEQHSKHPGWRIYGSETSSTVQSRGIYHFPYSVATMTDDDEQCSCLGNCTTSWGAKSVEEVIKNERDHAFSAGQFLWSGFDYIGEPTPYDTKNSYFGQLDTAGFAKDTFYIFKAEWTDARTAPFVHLFPYWDFNEGQMIDVRAASNAASVELFVNGVSQGKKVIDHEKGSELCQTWQVPYHKGEIEAVAYSADGKEIARDKRCSFGEIAELRCRRLKESDDPVFFEIFGVDINGNEVENADARVNVFVECGELLGLDNGDSTDFDQYKCSSRRLFGNRLLAAVRPANGYRPGDIRLYASLDKTVPIRKLEFVSEGGQKFCPGHTTIDIEARILPENSSFRDIVWAAVNDRGVPTHLASLKARGNRCKLTALGDGSFRLRCMTLNGGKKYQCISSLEFTAEGLGTAYLDPYGFIAGAGYSDSRGNVTGGNEKGVATPDNIDGYVGYENIDFGETGSDEVTIPIFTLDSKEYTLEIWEGRPGEEGSELLCDGRYCKPSQWNVYQPETYKLKRKVRGITNIYFRSDAKYHIKGFSFSHE